ncbi:MAG: hypothetical protein Q9211_005902 [Gyalolechia sp. 1 TL-2023]
MSKRFFVSSVQLSKSRFELKMGNFDPATFLSSLRNRHQTLEDLRAELRTRSQDISKELLDLVNDNYQDFLSLGSSLQGGDEKVEEVRLGLLGFRREVEGLKDTVDQRKKEVEALIAQRKEIRKQMQLGRALLDVDYRLQQLERSLMVNSNEESYDPQVNPVDQDTSDGEDESDEGQEGNALTARLDRHVRQYLITRMIMDRVGPDHPSINNQETRMTKVKNTILLDLGNALKQMGSQDDEQVTTLLRAYRDLGESKEALKVLKERRQ